MAAEIISRMIIEERRCLEALALLCKTMYTEWWFCFTNVLGVTDRAVS